MKAVRVNEHGGPEVLSYEDVPVPEPGEGQARVRLAASGVNFIDVYQRTGVYPQDLPFTLGQVPTPSTSLPQRRDSFPSTSP